MNLFRWLVAVRINLTHALLASTLLMAAGRAEDPDTRPDVGVRFQPPTSVLLRGGHVVVDSDKQLDSADVLIRDGKLAAIGNNLSTPADAEVIDCQGKFLYPAFVDALVEFDAKKHESLAGYWNSNVTPERKMAESLQADKAKLENLRKAGVGAVLATPNSGIIKGQSCVVSTADVSLSEGLHRADVFQHMRMYPVRGTSEQYPNSPMGATALIRQTLLDADWYGRAHQAASANPALPQPDQNTALQALEPVIRARQRVVIDGTNELYALRGDRIAKEFLLKLIIRGSGREYRQLDAVAATGREFIIPIDFPDAPKLTSESELADATLQSLMHWRLAPENPARLEQAGVAFVITTDGLAKPAELLTKLRIAVASGLSERKALAALTSDPARLLGVEQLVGSLEVGKFANILITSGPLLAKETTIEETWVQGHRDQWEPELTVDPRGAWQLILKDDTPTLRLEIAGKADKLTAKLGLPSSFTKRKPQKAGENANPAAAPQTTGNESTSAQASQKSVEKSAKDQPLEVKEIKFDGLQLTGAFETHEFDDKPKGRAWLTVVLLQRDLQTLAIEANVMWPDGSTTRYVGSRLDEVTEINAEEEQTAGDREGAAQERPPAPKPNRDEQANTQKNSENASQVVACDVNYPLGAYGRTGLPQQPEVLLIKHATVWTCDDAGVLQDADLLVRRGIIEKVGHDLDTVEGAVVVDATGLHVSPGIIDCHSHMATDGGVNESGQAVTAEVRIGDFIDSNDITIYRQLAGGVTTSNILHGSANPIGGQNQVIKLRWGSLDEDLKMREAPAGIKFALGENVKQSNREERGTRYPQSRMGVEQLMRDRFEAARDYRRQWNSPDNNIHALPPRRDLELDAIAEILEGNRWVHCHSYRQDEILMVLRLLDDYDVTIGSLQHILEGYKVADAMAAHGASGSSFSDWWAYKFEVIDAIPYNGALMHRAGVVVSFNSDDAELARHLNHEAAKAVKYGRVEPSEALKFVTLNPAKQLRIDRWVGSLSPGKHADFVIWNRSPLSTLSVCQQTWIDGRKYFDRAQDLVRREQDEQLRRQLVQLAVAKGDDKGDANDDQDPSMWWARYDEFCHHGHDEHE